MSRTYEPRWLLTASIASAGVVFAAPLVGQFTVWLRDVAKDQYVLALALIVATAATLAVGFAVFAIRERHWQRYGWLLASVSLAVTYGALARTGVADTDAAERFHFVEYGLLTVLFYKAWRPSADGAVLVMPFVAGLLVGTMEEWLQWFVPARVGELKDVLLNAVAVSSGLLFAIALDPPPELTLSLSPRSRRRVAVLGAIAIAAFAGFFQSVHLGHEIADREAGVFRSRYSMDELHAESAARAERWKTEPPITWSRYSREDQFLTEGVAHVRRRNQRWDEGNVLAARQENLILEKYYQPVLDAPSYVSVAGHRWPEAQRRHAEQVPGPGFMIYESDALTYPVVTWPPAIYWLVIAVAILLTLRRML
jgi:VanZ family protein